MVEQERPIVIPPEQYAEEWQEAPEIFEYEPGIVELELPRGFTNALLGEVGEEILYRAGEILFVTHCNPNTTLSATSPFVVALYATRIPANIQPDPNEKIKRVIWMKPEDLRDLKTLCDFTQANWRRFRLWALKQENAFLKEIGQCL